MEGKLHVILYFREECWALGSMPLISLNFPKIVQKLSKNCPKKPNFRYYPDPSLIALGLINQFAQPDMLDDHGFWKTSGATGVYVQEIVGRTYGLGYRSWLRVGVRLQFYGLVQVDTLLHHAADGERRAAGAGNFAPRTGVKKLEGR